MMHKGSNTNHALDEPFISIIEESQQIYHTQVLSSNSILTGQLLNVLSVYNCETYL
jgi:hypothetical protein